MARKQAHFGGRPGAARHESFLRHAGFRWLVVAAGLCLAAAFLFSLTLLQPNFRLSHSGGSWFGYVSGTAGALLIVWLALLGIRKRAMTDGSWSLKAWVSAHVYLGLSLIVIVSLHSGLQFGWNIHTLAYGLMMLVIVSGIFGVIAYAVLPRRLSENRAETTQKQMLEIIRALDRRLLALAQPLEQSQAALIRASLERTRIGGNFLQRLTGLYPGCATRKAFQTLAGARRGMADGPRAAALDQILGLLEQKNATLEKARRHIRLRTLLEVWLYVHVPATFALIAALTAHIVGVFFYW